MQEVSLVRDGSSSTIVVTLLGVEDAVKELYSEEDQGTTKATFCGIKWGTSTSTRDEDGPTIFGETGLGPDDIWPSDAARRDLWHACLFPGTSFVYYMY